MTTLYIIELKNRRNNKDILIHFTKRDEYHDFLRFIPTLSESFDLKLLVGEA